MKGQRYIKTINHADRTSTRRSGASSIEFESFYEDISDHWQDRAKRLQLRRWRKIRDQDE
jgi:hypothetical protein